MKCDTCGNSYDNPLTIEQGGVKYVFDCFECAIHALAPVCEHCGCRVIGHGITGDNESVFCCEHCARHHNQHSVKKAEASL